MSFFYPSGQTGALLTLMECTWCVCVCAKVLKCKHAYEGIVQVHAICDFYLTRKCSVFDTFAFFFLLENCVLPGHTKLVFA